MRCKAIINPKYLDKEKRCVLKVFIDGYCVRHYVKYVVMAEDE